MEVATGGGIIDDDSASMSNFFANESKVASQVDYVGYTLMMMVESIALKIFLVFQQGHY